MIRYARILNELRFTLLQAVVTSFLLLYTSALLASTFDDARPLTTEQIEEGVINLIKYDQPLVLYVYFESDSATVTEDFQKMLESLNDNLASVKDYQFQINIIGHTDSLASREYNLALGLKRAEAAKSYLSPLLSDATSISKLASKGKDDPEADNSTALGKALNRRVEIEVSPTMLNAIKSNREIVFSRAGDSLLLNQGDNLILWDTEGQCPKSKLHTHNDQIIVSSLSPNNLLALSGGESQKVILWDIATSSIIREFTGHHAEITALEFSSNSRIAISGDLSGDIRIWDLPNNVQLNSLKGHESAVTAVALSSNGEYAVSGDASGVVIFWDIVRYIEVSRVNVHRSAITDVSFNETDDVFFSASRSRGLHVTPIFDDKCNFCSNETTGKIVRFDISRNGQNLLALFESGNISVWQTRTNKQSLEIDSSQWKIVSITYTANDELIMASDASNGIHFWDAVTGDYISNMDIKHWQEKGDFPQGGEHDSQQWFDKHSMTTYTWFPAQCYEMGCGPWNNNCSTSETPLHQACVEGFWMANNEVTLQQWQDLNDFSPSLTKQNDCEDEECLKLAVNQVSWEDAHRYTCKLNKSTGEIYRLPTEVEWEYACRDRGERIKYSNAASSKVVSGLDNMNTGVWEWTLDAFRANSYQQHTRHNAVDPGDNNYHFMNGNIYRTVRGGAWDKGSKASQCSRRFYDEPAARNFYTGFRLVKPGH